MPKVTIDQVDFYYDAAGTGTPVVYVHGGFASLAGMLLNLPQDRTDWTWEWDFAQHFYFVEYDRRGCYRSSCPEDGYGLQREAMDLEMLLDHLQLDTVHLIGSSAGGPLAVLFAATRPGRIRSLTLTGTTMNLFSYGDAATQIIKEQIEILDRDGAEAAFDQRPPGVEISFTVLWAPPEQAERGTLDQYQERQHQLNAQATQLPRATRVRYYAAELRSMQGYIDVDVIPYARQITAPTLVLHGSHDREVPLAWGEELAHTITGSQLMIMHGESHSLVLRKAEARRKVIEFIRLVENL
jgi:pimeloyl-ACP methyl ester carboxylesterase